MGKPKNVSVKYAMCITSGLRLSKKFTFSDALHQGLLIDSHIEGFFWKKLWTIFESWHLCDADTVKSHFRLEIKKTLCDPVMFKKRAS
jgi:hypothetical protein